MVIDLNALGAEWLMEDIKETKDNNDIYLEECIDKIAKKHMDAMSALYGRTSTAVFGYALSILKNRQDAEDVLHDCYVQIYRSADTYKRSGKPMAWILTITRNLCMQKFRRDSKVIDLPEDDWEPYLESVETLSVEEKILLQKCMKGLPTEELQIIILHAVAGYKFKEVADMIGRPLSTVLSKYSRAIKKLRQSLEEESINER